MKKIFTILALTIVFSVNAQLDDYSSNVSATGSFSIAMGYYTTASGWSTTAMGYGTIASGGLQQWDMSQ